MIKLAKAFTLLAGLLVATGLGAQNIITAELQDSSNGEPVPFATVSVSKEGAKKPDYYDLSSESGHVTIKKMAHQPYTM